MGRPRKTVNELVKDQNDLIVAGQQEQKKENNHTEEKKQLETDRVELLHLKNIAYGVTRNPLNQRWVVYSVDLDFGSRTLGTITVIEESMDRYIVLERLKVKFGDAFFGES